LSLIAAWGRRRGDELFVPRLREFSIGVGALLLIASLSHVKAIFPVSVALTALFAAQTALFRDRGVLRFGIAAWMLAAIGFTPFATRVLSVSAGDELPLLAWAIAGGLLLIPGAWADRRTIGNPKSEIRNSVLRVQFSALGPPPVRRMHFPGVRGQVLLPFWSRPLAGSCKHCSVLGLTPRRFRAG
jgi:hypothetical protein